MRPIELVGLVLLIITTAPVCVYFCVKLGTLGYLKAREHYKQESDK